MPPDLVRITQGQLEMSTPNKLGSNYGPHHQGLVLSHHERPGMLQWISINYEGVALMEKHSFAQLSYVISLQVLLVITTCVYIPELHYYAKLNTDRTFDLYNQIVGSCFIPMPTTSTFLIIKQYTYTSRENMHFIDDTQR